MYPETQIRGTAAVKPNNIFLLGISWQDQKTGIVNCPAMHPQSSAPRNTAHTCSLEAPPRRRRQDQMGEMQTFETVLGRSLKQAPIPLRVGVIDGEIFTVRISPLSNSIS